MQKYSPCQQEETLNQAVTEAYFIVSNTFLLRQKIPSFITNQPGGKAVVSFHDFCDFIVCPMLCIAALDRI